MSSATAAPATVACRAISCVDVIGVRALTQHEQHLTTLAWIQANLHVQRRARIQPGAKLRVERHVPEGGRPAHRTVAADERTAAGGRRPRRLAGVRERHACGKLGAVGVAREDGAARRIAGRGDVPAVVVARRAEHPVVVGEDTQGPRRAVVVGQRQQRELHRIVDFHEHRELVGYPSRHPGEAGDTRRMVDDELTARRVPRHRPRRRRPGISRLVVANEDRLGRRVDDRVVGE